MPDLRKYEYKIDEHELNSVDGIRSSTSDNTFLNCVRRAELVWHVHKTYYDDNNNNGKREIIKSISANC